MASGLATGKKGDYSLLLQLQGTNKQTKNRIKSQTTRQLASVSLLKTMYIHMQFYDTV